MTDLIMNIVIYAALGLFIFVYFIKSKKNHEPYSINQVHKILSITIISHIVVIPVVLSGYFSTKFWLSLIALFVACFLICAFFVRRGKNWARYAILPYLFVQIVFPSLLSACLPLHSAIMFCLFQRK